MRHTRALIRLGVEILAAAAAVELFEIAVAGQMGGILTPLASSMLACAVLLPLVGWRCQRFIRTTDVKLESADFQRLPKLPLRMAIVAMVLVGVGLLMAIFMLLGRSTVGLERIGVLGIVTTLTLGLSVLGALVALVVVSLKETAASAQVLAREMTRDLRRLSVIAERTNNSVIITDAQRRIVWCNDGFRRLTGYSLEDVKGKVPGTFLQCEQSDPTAIHQMREALHKLQPCHVVIKNRAKSGRVYTVDIEIQPLFDEDGTHTGFMSIECDVTEAIAAKATILAGERRLEAIVASTPGALYRCSNDADWTMSFISDAIESITGYPASDFTKHGRSYSSIIHRDDQEPVCRAVNDAIKTNSVWQMEYRLVHEDGSERWVLERGRSTDPQGQELVGFIVDITEHKHAQAELKANESRFRALVETAGVIFWECDAATGRFTYVSPQAAKLGYPLEDWLKPGFWKTILHSDDRESAVLFCQNETSAGRSHRFQYRVHCADGSVRHMDEVVNVELAEGNTGLIRGVLIDMTEQVLQRQVFREQSERLELTVRSANVGTWDWDIPTGRVRFNDPICTMLGYAPGEWSGRVEEWETRVHPDDLPEVRRVLEAHLAGKTAEYRCEHRLRRKDGSWNWVLDVGRVIERDAEGAARQMTGIHLDVHAAREASEAIKEARSQAEAASRAKSAFLANMSHEIRTPMTAILGYADLLAEFGDRQRAPQERLEYIDTIKRNGEHLLSIINDILDLSKIEAGKMTVECMAVDPRRVLHEVESLMSVKARAKGIALEIRQETPLPATMRSDPLRLRQILMNLVGNAIKFTELGKVTISASMNIDDPAHPRISFRIQDTGIGMSDEQLETLFMAFHQADSSTTRRFGGTGLGLHISKSLAQILGGEISASSVLGQGSTFTLTLDTGPIQNETLTRPAWLHDVAPERENAPVGSNSLKGIRVLLAEDGPDNRRLISHYLGKAGASLTVFENGLLALNHLTQSTDLEAPLHRPLVCDVVLTDMQMPELDGYALARSLRAKGWTGPIIALTAHAMGGDAERCMAAGCDAYATKPINQTSLVTIIRSALRHPLESF